MAGHLERVAMMGATREMLPFQDRYAKERMWDAFLEGHGAGARQAWRMAGADGAAPELALEGIDEAEVDRLAGLGSSIMPEILDGLERKEAGHALTLWRGFGAFCDETLGLDALKVLRVVLEAGAERVEELEAKVERLGLEPDAGTVEEIREGMTEAWRIVEARGA